MKIELSDQLEDLMQDLSEDTGDGILEHWNKIERLKKEYIGHQSEFIEEQRQEIGLNSSKVLGEYIFALFMHDRPYINTLMFTKVQAEVMDSNFKEKFKQKLLRSKEDIQLVRSLANNPYMMERFNINKKMLSDMESDVEQEVEADLDLASLYEKPYKQKRIDMYLRQCEKNLWIEMANHKPKIPEHHQVDTMMKLMAHFEYDAMHEPGRVTREGEPIDFNAKRDRVRKRKQRLTK